MSGDPPQINTATLATILARYDLAPPVRIAPAHAQGVNNLHLIVWGGRYRSRAPAMTDGCYNTPRWPCTKKGAPMTTRTALVVIGLIEQQGQILLVQQRGPTDPAPYWVAPGGLVEAGESLSEALAREVAEECGLEVQQIGALTYCTQIDHPARAAQTLAFAFPIPRWSGTPASRDPDGEVLDARWVAQDAAIARLASVGWRGMREPLVAYLDGSAPAGTIWQYREVDGEQRLLTRLPDPPHTGKGAL